MSNKLFKSALSASLALGAIVAVTPAVEADGFKDVNGDSETGKAIEQLVDRGIIKGFGDNTFRPNKPVTREQVARMLAGVLELDTKNGTKTFKDVPKTHPNYGVISALAEADILNGYSNGTFQPKKPVTRGEIAIMLSKAFKLTPSGETLPFKDVKAGSPTYKYVDALYSNGITKGTTAHTFGVNKPVTRGQLATFIVRAEAKKHSSVTLEAEEFGIEDFSFIDDEQGIYNLNLSEDKKKITLTPLKEGTSKFFFEGISGYKDGETLWDSRFYFVNVKKENGGLKLNLEEADLYENIEYATYVFDNEEIHLTFTPTKATITDANGKQLDQSLYDIVMTDQDIEVTLGEFGDFKLNLSDDKGNSSTKLIDAYLQNFVLEFDLYDTSKKYTLNSKELGFKPASFEFQTAFDNSDKPYENPVTVDIVNNELVLNVVKDGAVYVLVKGANGKEKIITVYTEIVAGELVLFLDWE
ncbi:S-layer homology domain-containing protein [Lysinibacillus sp. 54212]|uniref:S-layer homology domain-containing protein n=1 Tax=Lysinibacillus sp. 54212 TaxID=3119829 RepID=UPI002FC78743